ncbi:MAG: hypothetical protein VKJ24_09475 [Synechococcales bacterium]|nr:hypothetical protein [Synechococcales bacterium]
MLDNSVTFPLPATLQELDEAVLAFKSSDCSGDELFYRWQAIRDASLQQFSMEADSVPGADSY